MSYNSFRDNFPMGFDGVEGEEEETFIFFLSGEIELDNYTEEEAEQEFLDMTVRELVQKGFEIE